jgi:hypothetical protein
MVEVDSGLDTEEAAEFLGFAPQTLSVWRMQGRGPEFYKADRRVKYSMQALEDFRHALDTVRGLQRDRQKQRV